MVPIEAGSFARGLSTTLAPMGSCRPRTSRASPALRFVGRGMCCAIVLAACAERAVSVQPSRNVGKRSSSGRAPDAGGEGAERSGDAGVPDAGGELVDSEFVARAYAARRDWPRLRDILSSSPSRDEYQRAVDRVGVDASDYF